MPISRETFEAFIQTLKYPPNPFQRAILESIAFETSGHIVVSALAGSGKTSLLMMLANLFNHMGSPSATFLAFNKKIRDEMNQRLPANYRAINSHSLGNTILLNRMPKTKMDYKKWSLICRELVEDHYPHRDVYNKSRTLEALCSKVMLNAVDPADLQAVLGIAVRYRLFNNETPDQFILGRVATALNHAQEVWERTGAISFDEMLYLPVKLKLPPPTFTYVLVDECLPSLTPVQLADGTAKTIGEIVENKLAVEVLAYDTTTGQQRACKVTGWSKILNQKPLVKIRVKWTKRKGTCTPSNFVVCTVDHKVWANGQWMYAGDVRPGMKMQIETGAVKSQAYKITTKGRKTLAESITSREIKGSTKGRIKKRGGNGRGMTLPQQVLFDALGEGWIPEHKVTTGKAPGCPNHYKVDIACPDRMIAIEVDGRTHDNPTRREQDARKTAFLESKGWRVIRVSNREAIQQTEMVVGRINTCSGDDCPIDGIVTSVEPVEIPDYFVYDITVEDCHNFYANGILVHNCQDLNVLQQDIAFSSLEKGGRYIFVGDKNQAIYGFAGADAASFDRIIDTTGGQVYPLNTCYRCPTSHIEAAQRIVPQLEAAPNAEPGVIEYVKSDLLPTLVKPGVLVMCRLNAPLISAYFDLIARQIPAKVMGKDIGRDLVNTLEKVANFDGFRYERLIEYLEVYRKQQLHNLEQKGANESQVELLNDKVDCLIVCVENFDGVKTLTGLKDILLDLFKDDNDDNWNKLVALCTVHKAKGLEADETFILRPEKMPLRWPGQARWELEQELNIKYVALTRARKKLTVVIDTDDALGCLDAPPPVFAPEVVGVEPLDDDAPTLPTETPAVVEPETPAPAAPPTPAPEPAPVAIKPVPDKPKRSLEEIVNSLSLAELDTLIELFTAARQQRLEKEVSK